MHFILTLVNRVESIAVTIYSVTIIDILGFISVASQSRSTFLSLVYYWSYFFIYYSF
jgi:hypothetical protein